MKFYLTIILTIVFIGVCKAQDKVHIDTASNCSPDAAAANTMGSLLDDKGETEKAADYYRLAIQYDPKCGPAYNNLGGYYFKSKKYAEAILLYRKALQMDERWAWLYYYNTAKSYVALGQYEDAVKNYGEVTRLRPKETSVYYTRANLCLRIAQGVTAASDAQSFLKLKGWRNKDSQYAVLIGYLGYRQAHLDDDAHNLLIESAKANKSEWPYPVIRYLSQEITEQDLLALATDKGKMTEAQTYIGMNLSLSGKHKEGIDHLRWVKENGDHDFYEYKLSISELERIDK